MAAPNKIQQALSLFSELQAVPFVDIDDESRTAKLSTAEKRQPIKPGANTKSTQLVADLRNEIEQLKRQNAISNAIIKKLHKRNKELETKQQTLGGSLRAVGSSISPRPQPEEIPREIELELSNLRRQASVAHRPPSPIQASAQITSNSLLHQRIKSLEADYKSLLNVKLECIAEGETTGKVNKEVKNFFAHLKLKLSSSERDWEIERAMWQLKVFELQSQQMQK